MPDCAIAANEVYAACVQLLCSPYHAHAKPIELHSLISVARGSQWQTLERRGSETKPRLFHAVTTAAALLSLIAIEANCTLGRQSATPIIYTFFRNLTCVLPDGAQQSLLAWIPAFLFL